MEKDKGIKLSRMNSSSGKTAWTKEKKITNGD
jgi:hypothetical protein